MRHAVIFCVMLCCITLCLDTCIAGKKGRYGKRGGNKDQPIIQEQDKPIEKVQEQKTTVRLDTGEDLTLDADSAGSWAACPATSSKIYPASFYPLSFRTNWKSCLKAHWMLNFQHTYPSFNSKGSLDLGDYEVPFYVGALHESKSKISWNHKGEVCISDVAKSVKPICIHPGYFDLAKTQPATNATQNGIGRMYMASQEMNPHQMIIVRHQFSCHPQLTNFRPEAAYLIEASCITNYPKSPLKMNWRLIIASGQGKTMAAILYGSHSNRLETDEFIKQSQEAHYVKGEGKGVFKWELESDQPAVIIDLSDGKIINAEQLKFKRFSSINPCN